MKKWIIAAIVVVALLAVWLFTRSSDAIPVSQVTLPQSEKVVHGDLKVEVSASGVVEPINKVEIKSKASGQIEEMKVEESDPVKRGDLIALLDQKDTRNSYNTATADLEVAEATVAQKQSDFDRKSELYKKGLLSAADFDAAKLALVDAQAQVVRGKISLDNADIRLKETIVRSPIDGVVLTKDVEVGQIIASGISSVSGGTLIATVANMNRVYVKADVDEVDIGSIQPGMTATVVADAYPDKVFNGRVIRIAAQGKVTSNVTTFEVTIEVENPEGRLKASMNTSVEILVADKKNVLLVANEALMTRKELEQEIGKLRMLANPQAAGKPSAMARGQQPAGRGGELRGAGMRPPAGGFAAASGGPAGAPGGMGNRPSMSEGSEADQGLRRGVLVKQGNDYAIRMVKTGVANLDQTEVLAGLNENDEVVYTFYSRATEASAQMRQRMTAMESQRSGFRSN
ncbi:MAG TPA: efflux RND transporter periplasmic adaptor subunit [bacterium]|nr:efflux RND transporter periplasmic adaptor subunit [bacterium]HPR88619.1 efflux RND transporter periplasmic adaptor subunit [bacterium]